MTLYTTGRRPFLWTKENEWSQEKKQAIQCGWPVCMKNAVTQITEGSQRPSDPFWEMWLQMVPRVCEMLGPDYSFLESWHIQGNFKVRCKVIKYSPQKIKLLTWSALILAKIRCKTSWGGRYRNELGNLCSDDHWSSLTYSLSPIAWGSFLSSCLPRLWGLSQSSGTWEAGVQCMLGSEDNHVSPQILQAQDTHLFPNQLFLWMSSLHWRH